MKKNIFELDKKERRQLLKEFEKNLYYKQYLHEFVSALLVISIFSGIIIGYTSASDLAQPHIIKLFEALELIVTMGFISVFTVIFAFKRLDLLKTYYETKNKKEK